MSEADVPNALAIATFAVVFGLMWGYRIASKSNKSATSTSPAGTHQLGEELTRTRGEYKDYRDDVDTEFSNINVSIKRLNVAYAALLNNFVEDAEKLCPENKAALKIASNDRDLIAIGHAPAESESPAGKNQ